jgi:hypothetical protein
MQTIFESPQIFGVVLLSQIRKFLRCASSQITNCKFLWCFSWLIAIRKFFTKRQGGWNTSLKSSVPSRSFHDKTKILPQASSVKLFLVQIWIRACNPIFAKRKIGYLRIWESSPKNCIRKRKSQKKTRPADRKSAKWHICGTSANLTNLVSPQVWGFAVCETYLRTTNLYKMAAK